MMRKLNLLAFAVCLLQTLVALSGAPGTVLAQPPPPINTPMINDRVPVGIGAQQLPPADLLHIHGFPGGMPDPWPHPALRIDYDASNGFGQLGYVSAAGQYSSVSAIEDFVLRSSTNAHNLILAATRPNAVDPMQQSNGDGGRIRFTTQALTGTDQERMAILSNGNIGIGVSEPRSLLELPNIQLSSAGAHYFTGSSAPSIIGNNWYTGQRYSSNTQTMQPPLGGYWIAEDMINPVSCAVLMWTNGDISLSTGQADNDSHSATYQELQNNTIYHALLCHNGNFGVGWRPWGISSNNPSSRLDVNGNASIGADFAGVNAAPANGLLVEGNVGIGNTSPAEALEVTGNVRLTGVSTGAGRSIETGNTGRLNLYSNTACSNSRTWIEMWGASDNTRLGELALTGTYLSFRFGADGAGNCGTEGMRFDANGNLGIGTTSPSAQLDVANSIRFRGLSNTTTDTRILVTDNNGNVAFSDIGGIGGWSLTGNANTNPGTGAGQNFLGTTGNTDFVIATNSTEAMRVTSGGRVGIGTTTPLDRVHLVNGCLRLGNPIPGNNAPGLLANDYPPFVIGTNPIQINGGANQAVTEGIIFSGGQALGGLPNPFEADNSDPMWMVRVNTGVNQSRLVVSLGDDGQKNAGNPDFFQVGGLSSGTQNFIPTLTVRTDGQVDVDGSEFCTGGAWFGSDARYKTNIAAINNPLAKVTALNGVTFEFRRKDYPAEHFDSLRNMGFIAQEVESVVPEVVRTNGEGYKAVNYGALVALAVEAIKEQQSAIEQQQSVILSQQKELDDLSNRVSILEGGAKKPSIGSQPNVETGGVQFFQNNPNPFSESTTISFFIPTSVQQAELVVFDAVGRNELQTLPLTQRGLGQITINADKLASDTYFYTIRADGQEMPAKKMVVLK